METKNNIKESGTKEIVLAFITALNEENFEKAKACLNDDMVFDGVLGHREGAEAYMEDLKKMKFKYNIQKAFEDGNDVCLFYDIDMSGKTNIFTCGWYKLKNEKIKSIKVVFDPRPVLEKSDKK